MPGCSHFGWSVPNQSTILGRNGWIRVLLVVWSILEYIFGERWLDLGIFGNLFQVGVRFRGEKAGFAFSGSLFQIGIRFRGEIAGDGWIGCFFGRLFQIKCDSRETLRD